MLKFLFIVVLWLFLFPVLMFIIRVLWNGYKLRRFMRDPLGETQRRARKAYERQQAAYGQNHHQEPVHKKKKIDPDVGEYIAFTEVDAKISETDANGNTTSTEYHEQQVTDVEWEDL